MNRADRNRWAQTHTLADVGELTAQWLEGKIKSQPGYYGGPAQETESLVPVLAVVNRAGFVTCTSQPGDQDGQWQQRAAVQGFADGPTLTRLRCAVSRKADLILVVNQAPRWRSHYQHRQPVTRAGGVTHTAFGAALSCSHLRDPHVGYGVCHPDAIRAVCEAWQVTIVDPEWGRNDVLWPALECFAGMRS